MEVTIKLRGTIATSSIGHQKLLDLNNECKKYENTTITFCFENLSWIDGNMVAIFGSHISRLKNENNLAFFADLSKARRDFSILVRNGFLKPKGQQKRFKNTTEVRLASFTSEDCDGYGQYIENEFLNHKNLVLNEEYKDEIIDSLGELFANYGAHSKSKMPLSLCGQYYPTKQELKMTIHDQGVGFLQNVSAVVPEITVDSEAIRWAVKRGNTTRPKTMTGGDGLYNLKNYLIKHNGILEIVSGAAYVTYAGIAGTEVDTVKLLRRKNIGTTINLIFKNF